MKTLQVWKRHRKPSEKFAAGRVAELVRTAKLEGFVWKWAGGGFFKEPQGLKEGEQRVYVCSCDGRAEFSLTRCAVVGRVVVSLEKSRLGAFQ